MQVKWLQRLSFTPSQVWLFFLIAVCIVVLIMRSDMKKKNQQMGKKLMEDQKLLTDEMQST